MRPIRVRVFACGLLALCSVSTPAAGSPAGPGGGGGTRTVSAPKANTKASAPAARQAAPRATTPVDHKQGRPPKTPAARLPEGAKDQSVDRAARRQIADGTPLEDAQKGPSDPELEALREAERALFPRPLVGFRPGWSWGRANPSAQADGLPPVVEALPSATLGEATHAEWLRSLAMPDFPLQLEARVVEYLRFYRDDQRGRDIARVWARKVGRYTAAMRAELIKSGLPKDLVWLSLIESGHNPTIVSPAGAAGMWQFMPETARLYGLTVDRWVDERLDPQRSTRAAARFLSDLHQRFGTWELAMAAYNMGHAGLLRSVRKYNTNDFWKLGQYEAGLPWETTLYVPKIFAIAIVMNNLRAFGLDDVEQDPAISFDTVYVDSRVPLEDVARAAGIPVEALRSMNPQYQARRLPPVAEGAPERRWPLRVPRGSGKSTTDSLLNKELREEYLSYTARFGDTLSSIAEAVQTSEDELLALNGPLGPQLGREDWVVPGTVLLVPRRKLSTSPAASEEVVVVPARQFRVAGRERVFYRIIKGDTLSSVANAHGVTPEELVVWNDLDPRAKLQAGMSLQVYVAKHLDLSEVRTLEARRAKVLEVGSEEFLVDAEARVGRQRMTVKAKAGDTLAKIGGRYGLSVGMMERINRFSRSRPLSAGEPIIVYAKLPAKGQEAANSDGRPLASIEAPRPDVLPGEKSR